MPVDLPGKLRTFYKELSLKLVRGRIISNAINITDSETGKGNATSVKLLFGTCFFGG